MIPWAPTVDNVELFEHPFDLALEQKALSGAERDMRRTSSPIVRF